MFCYMCLRVADIFLLIQVMSSLLFKLRQECEVGHFGSWLHSLFLAGDLDEKVGK